ncbi:hypothetical protein B7494_g4956 [Chlorociboria aeruginascens]|nr:hypothetical protein B7494_g4956 [Chlorociboria aeruginascens]
MFQTIISKVASVANSITIAQFTKHGIPKKPPPPSQPTEMGGNATKESDAGNKQVVVANSETHDLFNEDVADRNNEASKTMAAEARLIHGASINKTGPYLPGPHERALERKFAESNEENHKFYYDIKGAIMDAVFLHHFKDGIFDKLIDDSSTLRHDFNTMAFADVITPVEKKVIEDACRVYCKSLGDWRTQEQTSRFPEKYKQDKQEWKTNKGFGAINKLKLMFDADRMKVPFEHEVDAGPEDGSERLQPLVYNNGIESGDISDTSDPDLEIAPTKKSRKQSTFADDRSKVALKKNDRSLNGKHKVNSNNPVTVIIYQAILPIMLSASSAKILYTYFDIDRIDLLMVVRKQNSKNEAFTDKVAQLAPYTPMSECCDTIINPTICLLTKRRRYKYLPSPLQALRIFAKHEIIGSPFHDFVSVSVADILDSVRATSTRATSHDGYPSEKSTNGRFRNEIPRAPNSVFETLSTMINSELTTKRMFDGDDMKATILLEKELDKMFSDGARTSNELSMSSPLSELPDQTISTRGLIRDHQRDLENAFVDIEKIIYQQEQDSIEVIKEALKNHAIITEAHTSALQSTGDKIPDELTASMKEDNKDFGERVQRQFAASFQVKKLEVLIISWVA